eukprot:CAMPEP_0197023394 /NCGR_PEP_ID=MMETSP1384-20130603/4088_1 /TAXON_ID=29189 /ORGANISM="Ammonia sp." /LENGTH=727 /DNA_ID=CAMNT_0042451597 /DNA_START=155 /DNA_END=2338 /DNA_ORIENTATION=-
MCDTPTNGLKKTANPDMKYVVITGGVVSGLGKGITASSIGLLLKSAGLRVTAIKIDPYLNIDAGTMSPYEHGEVFVLDDGGEVDLDLGNYERFLHITLTRDHNITTGKVYQRVLDTERRGDYLGKTVQMVPHVSNCIQDWIERVSQIPVDGTSEAPQVCVIELGGTVGDIESMIFLEAIRQFRFRCGSNLCHVHVSLIPSLGNVGELKSKPTQHSMVQLRSTGLIPDIVVLRCSQKVPANIINKVSMFSMVPKENIVGVHDVANIYQVPQLLLEQGVTNMLFQKMGLHQTYDPNVDVAKFNKIAKQLADDDADESEADQDNDFNDNANTNSSKKRSLKEIEPEKHDAAQPPLKKMKLTKDAIPTNSTQESDITITPLKTVSIGIVGKYTGLTDSYLSVTKALLSAALDSELKLQIVWIESTQLEPINDENSAENGGDVNGESSLERSPSIEERIDKVHNIPIYNEASPQKQRHLNQSKVKSFECKTAWNKLKSVDGILIPGGFGDRGIEGKILAVEYARTHKIPFLGICLGMQMAVIEFCRNVLKLSNANSTEFDADTKNAAVIFMPEGDKEKYGGTMRLGSRVCNLSDKSMAKYLYANQSEIYERHRHRYEVNPELVTQIEQHGLVFTGKDEHNERMEIIELPLSEHPFFFGCQFHPEFKSGPLRPSPPFKGLIKAASGLLYQDKQFVELFGAIQKEQTKPKLKFVSHKKHKHMTHHKMECVTGEK